MSEHNQKETCCCKMKHYINSCKKIIIKILNLKLVMLLEYQNIKAFLQITFFCH